MTRYLAVLFLLVTLSGCGCDDTVLVADGVPLILADTDSLDFGEVPIGSNASLTVALSNAGRRPLHLSGVAVDDEQFVAHLTTLQLLPGEKTRVEVVFAPTTVAEIPGNLVVSSDAHNANQLRIGLMGRGVSVATCDCQTPPLSH